MRKPMMSGLCAFPQTAHPEESHALCRGGNTANPSREFAPCPCECHLGDERFDCANCEFELAEAPLWPNEEDPDEPVYVHVDHKGRAIGEECPG